VESTAPGADGAASNDPRTISTPRRGAVVAEERGRGPHAGPLGAVDGVRTLERPERPVPPGAGRDARVARVRIGRGVVGTQGVAAGGVQAVGVGGDPGRGLGALDAGDLGLFRRERGVVVGVGGLPLLFVGGVGLEVIGLCLLAQRDDGLPRLLARGPEFGKCSRHRRCPRR
jgi:hypothetical protein